MALVLTITNAGRAALRNADASGTRAVRIASVGVSAAALAATVDTAALPGEIKRITTMSGAAVAADIIHLTVSDETMATYTVRSFALYLDDGTLFAAYGQADPIIEKSAQALMVLTVDVTLADIAAAQITFGDANFLMPPATVERQGLVELATVAEAKAGTDPSRAVTPATAKGAVRDWIGYTPADRAGDTFTGPVRSTGSIAAGIGGGYAELTPGGGVYTGYISFFSKDDARRGYIGFATSTGPIKLVSENGAGFAVEGGPLAVSDAIRRAGNAVWDAGNDGAGSGLDADLLDGQQGSWYADIVARLGYAPVQCGTGIGQRANVVKLGWSGDQLKATVDTTDFGALVFASEVANVWRATNDGAGSGLDADMLDGRQAAEFALLTGAAFSGPVRTTNIIAAGIGGGYAQLTPGEATYTGYISFHSSGGARRGYIGFATAAGPVRLVSDDGAGFSVEGGPLAVTGAIRRAGNNVWDAGNDGAGSGLDADLLDGQQGSWYADIVARLGYAPVQCGTGIGQRTNVVKLGWSGDQLKATIDTTDFGALVFASEVANVWRVTNDGAGSGMDADLLDGRQGSEYALLTGASYTGPVAVAGALTRAGNSVWDAGNDGAGSGLDADLLDGQDGSWYGNIPARLGYQPLRASDVADVWRVTNDGAGSGLDADLLDGRDGDWYRRWANLTEVPATFPPSGHTHGAADLAGAFPGSLAENGYIVLPNGLILQWMTGPMQAGRTSAANYMQWPIAFPNACFQAFVSTQTQSASDRGDSWFQLVGIPDQNGATIQRQASGTADDIVASAPRVFAIGN